MPEVRGYDKPNAERRMFEIIDLHCQTAFEHGCRLAVRIVGSGDYMGGYQYVYEFMVISPDEYPPHRESWTLYEDRSGRAVGRST